MNRIYKNIMLVFTILDVVMFAFLSVIILQGVMRMETNYLKEIVSQVMENTDKAQEGYSNKLLLMEQVWYERVRTSEEMLASGDLPLTEDSLARLNTMVSAKSIHVFDRDGQIMLSTNAGDAALMQSDEQSKLNRLISGEAERDFYVHVEDAGFWENPRYCRMVIRSTSDRYGALCIEADTTQMGLKSEKTIIEQTLHEAATEYKTSVVAVGSDSGTVLGMTQNNEQALDIAGNKTKDRLLSFLKETAEKGAARVKINGEYCLMAVSAYDGAYMLAFSPVRDHIHNVFRPWGYTLVLFILASIVMFYAIAYNFRKYLLEHLKSIEHNVNEIMDGNFSANLSEGNNPEINRLIRTIQKLKHGYVHKSERMDKIMDVMGDDIAVFEFVSETDYFFFSDRIQELLGMSDEEWQTSTRSNDKLLELLVELDKEKDETGIVRYKDKYLLIQICQVGKDIVGVLADRTKEMTQRQKLESELKLFRTKMDRDDLTKLLNRGGFESLVRRCLEESQSGVLLAFDLDNFKQVNDNAGHPEGDRVLQIFADCLQDVFRNGDLIGRLGGDEFSVFMVGSIDKPALKKKMSHLLEAIERCFGDYHRLYDLSSSIGVAFTEINDTYDQLYRRADEALYLAKRNGKNGYAIYEA